MATDIISITAPNAEEYNLQTTWAEIVVTVIFTGFTVLIVGTISVLMIMA